MKQVDNSEPLLAPGSDKAFMITSDGEEDRPAYPSDMIRLLLSRAPVKTMADSHHSLRVFDVIKADAEDVTPDVLKFEDADHAWLLKAAEIEPPPLGLMASRLKDALQPMSVSERKTKRNGRVAESAKETAEA